ncbi:MAG: D-aminoacyl-tRNA deacylase [Bacteroidota bacterium]
MRAVVQRVRQGGVTSGGRTLASIGKGYVILVGVRMGDTREDALFLADKCAALRVMADAEGKMNLSLRDAGGAAIVVSQFTLYGDARKGNRPGFSDAAPPNEAIPLYELFISRMREHLGSDAVHTGEFGAMMDVTIVNDGPVTILLESPNHNHPRSATP